MPDSNKEDKIEIFRKIRKATDEAISSIPMEESSEAINWGDVSCHRVYWWTDDSGDCGYISEVEEASPDAIQFQRYVEEYVLKVTGKIVCVTTEW